MTLYARRNTAALGEYYVRHIEAVTDEDLCDASDIAAELAWRDREIDSLRVQMGAQIAPLKVPMEAPPKYQSIPTPPGRPNGSLPAYPIDNKYGLTKRELIAAMVLQGSMANSSAAGTSESYAKEAVEFADALLEELAR